jgi:hypothetical protein
MDLVNYESKGQSFASALSLSTGTETKEKHGKIKHK